MAAPRGIIIGDLYQEVQNKLLSCKSEGGGDLFSSVRLNVVWVEFQSLYDDGKQKGWIHELYRIRKQQKRWMDQLLLQLLKGQQSLFLRFKRRKRGRATVLRSLRLN